MLSKSLFEFLIDRVFCSELVSQQTHGNNFVPLLAAFFFDSYKAKTIEENRKLPQPWSAIPVLWKVGCVYYFFSVFVCIILGNGFCHKQNYESNQRSLYLYFLGRNLTEIYNESFDVPQSSLVWFLLFKDCFENIQVCNEFT